MNSVEIQNTESLLAWMRVYFALCAAVYLAVAAGGGLYATTRTNRWRWILPAMGLMYIVSVPFHWAFTNDDSYIFYRFAENIAAGNGIVYNLGVPCEGFTSPAWTITLSLAVELGFPVHAASKVLGGVLGAVAILFMILTVRRLTDDSRTVFLSALFVTSAQILQAWIPSGMDTALFVAWLAIWAYFLVCKPQSWVILISTAAVGAWIRPEAYLVSLVGLGSMVYSNRSRLDFRRIAAITIATGVALALPIVWRYLTFGEVLPTTFYAKSDRTLRSGVGFLFGAINGYGAIPATAAVVGLWMMRKAHVWAISTAVTICLYVVWVGGDVLTQRFSLWWMPFAAIGLATTLNAPLRSPLTVSRLVVPLVASLLVGQELHRMYVITKPRSEEDGYSYVSANGIHTEEADASLGRYLSENAAPTDTLVTDNIGAIGYYSGLHVFDVLGLVDPDVASLIYQDRKEQIAPLVATRHPQWMICNELPGSGEPHLPNLKTATVGITESYEEVGRWRSRTGYSRILYRRAERAPN